MRDDFLLPFLTYETLRAVIEAIFCHYLSLSVHPLSGEFQYARTMMVYALVCPILWCGAYAWSIYHRHRYQVACAIVSLYHASLAFEALHYRFSPVVKACALANSLFSIAASIVSVWPQSR